MWFWNLLVHNRDWLFSGAGVAIITASVSLVVWLVRKILAKKTDRTAPQSAFGSITIAPIFNNTVGAQAGILPSAPVSSGEEIGIPVLTSIPPRITSVVGSDHGLKEGGDSFEARAVVAAFRMRKWSEKRRSVSLIARLTYRTNPDAFFREPSKILHRVHYGMWLGEDFNFVSLNLTNTKELILAVSADGKCVAVQDNRHSVGKRDDETFFEFPEALESFLVEVALLDDEFGHLVSFNYEIRTKPLSVHEVISVLPEGFSG